MASSGHAPDRAACSRNCAYHVRRGTKPRSKRTASANQPSWPAPLFRCRGIAEFVPSLPNWETAHSAARRERLMLGLVGVHHRARAVRSAAPHTEP